MEILEYLLARIKVTDTGCFEWQRSRDCDGYAIGRKPGSRMTKRITRVMYEAVRGPISPRAFVCHHCDNPPCINPAHLFLGTARDNSHDAMRKQRLTHGEAVNTSVLSPDQVLEICSLYESGLSATKIADRFSVAPNSVVLILKGRTWKSVDRPAVSIRNPQSPGEGNPASKLTADDVREIRRLEQIGRKHKQIASLFGVTAGCISSVARRRTWRHVA